MSSCTPRTESGWAPGSSPPPAVPARPFWSATATPETGRCAPRWPPRSTAWVCRSAVRLSRIRRQPGPTVRGRPGRRRPRRAAAGRPSPRSTPTGSRTSASPSAPRWRSVWRSSGRRPRWLGGHRSRRWATSARCTTRGCRCGSVLLDRYPSIDRIGSLAAPVLVIAGETRRHRARRAQQAPLRRGAGAQAIRVDTRRRAQRPRAARRAARCCRRSSGSCRRPVSPSNTR